MIKSIEKGLSNIANSPFVKKHVDKCIENPQFLTTTLLATSISKDVFAYSLRVHNTLTNDKIPEDKKSFVATMDAVTGVTTAIVQLGSGLALSNKKVQSAMCNKLFSHLDKNSKLFKHASAGFAVVSTLIGATLIAKRVLVPFISTPIAEHFEKKHHEKVKNGNFK